MPMANTTSEKGYCTTRISRFEMYCAYESAWAVSNPVPCSISMVSIRTELYTVTYSPFSLVTTP